MKKKVLLLGASGMLGSAFVKTLMREHDVICPVRSLHPFLTSDLVTTIKLKDDLSLLTQIKEISDRIKPDLIINCVGLIKQKIDIQYDVDLVNMNAILPKDLSNYCIVNDIWLIHFSTDCVFDGTHGNYVEQDPPNPQDLYGLTKLVGEDIKNDSLVIRTSIIGHENGTANSLMDWFLTQNDQIDGYKNAWFSGLTTTELSKLISIIIKREYGLKGLYHISGPKTNKSELLKLIAKIYDRSVSVIDCETPVIDRSLIDLKFRQKTNLPTKSWTAMLHELKTTYGK